MKKYWPIILLTLIGGFLRLYRLGPSLQFLGDQGRDALVMFRLLTQGDLPFIGPITSVGGFYLGPLYYYLMAPFLWVYRFNPVGPAAATAFLGTLTIPVLYFVAKRIFNQNAALIAAALYAFAFIPISETRSAWNPNLMPLSALGIIYGLYSKNLLLLAASLGAALQFHYMIVFLLPWLVWQLFKARRNKQLFPAAVIFLALMAPLLLFEIKNNWLNTGGLIEFLTKNKYNQLDVLMVIKNTVGRSEQAIGMVLGFGRDFNPLRAWITRIFIAAVLVLYKRTKFLAAYLLLSIITLSFYQSNVYPHYLGYLFPAVFMLAGFMSAKLPKFATMLLIGFFIYVNLPPTFTLIRQNGNLKSVAAAAEFINRDIKLNGHSGVNLALLDGTRDYPAMNFRYFLTLARAPLLPVDAYPQTKILYVISPYGQTDLLEQPMWEIQAMLPATVSASWQLPNVANIYKIERL